MRARQCKGAQRRENVGGAHNHVEVAANIGWRAPTCAVSAVSVDTDMIHRVFRRASPGTGPHTGVGLQGRIG